MTEILVATHNANKREEIKTLLKNIKGISVINLDDLRIIPPRIVEDGRTFRENAVKKAAIMSRFFDGLVLADDSGLKVSALDGKPGVRSSRFARINATDGENNEKLLKLLRGTPEKYRNAEFVCHVALARRGELLATFEGTVKGSILASPKGRKGFGYDPLFLPDGHKKTFAEMSQANKNLISHRANALSQLKHAIGKFLKTT